MESRVRPPIVITHNEGVSFTAQIRSHRIVTDQSERGGGIDSGPSPVELLGTSLGSCIAFYIQQFCAARNLPYEGMRVEVELRSAKSPPRVEQFIVRVMMPDEIPERYVQLLKRVAETCPVHNTLSPGAKVTIDIAMPVLAAS